MGIEALDGFHALARVRGVVELQEDEAKRNRLRRTPDFFGESGEIFRGGERKSFAVHRGREPLILESKLPAAAVENR